VRTVDHEQGTILKALDCGAQGVHVPQVSTADQTESIVRAAKFPPEGTRGVAWSARSHLYGAGDGAGYLRRHNEESIVVVHVETEEAVRNIEEIASVPGLDVAYVGPADLSVALGHASEGPSHSEVRGAADRVLEACRERGMHVGYHVGGAQQARETFAWGASYVGVGITPVLFAAFKEVVGARDASLPHS
jgi:2-keto-3-deoxy-L-rhamnonate aldolase RhmA